MQLSSFRWARSLVTARTREQPPPQLVPPSMQSCLRALLLILGEQESRNRLVMKDTSTLHVPICVLDTHRSTDVSVSQGCLKYLCPCVRSVASCRMRPLDCVEFLAEVSRYQISRCCILENSVGCYLDCQWDRSRSWQQSALQFYLHFELLLFCHTSFSSHDMQNELRY